MVGDDLSIPLTSYDDGAKLSLPSFSPYWFFGMEDALHVTRKSLM